MQFVPFDNYYSSPFAAAPMYSVPQYYSYEDLMQHEYQRQVALERRRQAKAQAQQQARARAQAQQEARAQAIQRQRQLQAQRQAEHEEAVRAYFEQKVQAQRQQQQQAELQRRAEQSEMDRKRNSLAQAFGQPMSLGDLLNLIAGGGGDDYEEDETVDREDVMMTDDKDPEVSIPADDESDWDIYASEYEPACTPPAPMVEAPLAPMKPVEDESVDKQLAEFVNSLTTEEAAAPQSSRVNVNVQKSPQDEPEPEQGKKHKQKSKKRHSKNKKQKTAAVLESTASEAESVSEIDADTLHDIEKSVRRAVDTYNRIYKAQSSSASSESDTEYGITTITSRIKVLQKAQLKLEDLYTQLDTLPRGSGELRKLKRDLITESVSMADRVEDLVRVMQSHRTKLMEQQFKNTESESDVATPEPSSSYPVRHVTLETVPDDDSEFLSSS